MATQTYLNKVALTAPAQTGNNTHAAVACKPGNGFASPVAVQFVIDAVGATPTVDFKVQGSLDGTNWYDLAYITSASDTLSVAARTVTALGGYANFVCNSQSRGYNWFRVVTSANTNVTYHAELWVESL